ncbi:MULTISPECIES: DUF3822 family protein [Cellulophaga]|jgi:hypothetical protein|uniref:Uncharacterized protein n=1 Tax=Cellulophaga baltica TaxID=76594 RepID=A0A1G7I3S2_9FLAO|nr:MULTISPECIES: DUF3822 family protein [Cellulophaga]WFO17432.1 DUF3822 family protein [Cellulophaga baltica 4]AIY13782.1 hypothetical protein M667_11470 [Cellulophaga baltica NN016038]KGK28998.1 hypothetical protein EL45_17180 [Cellulophaga sp. E6(2014)]MBA6314869.1 DUF3822 family protein [Cellulophaga baltica]SDF07382.1 Protein of unknown function [Cellulophaga baltica]
MTKKKEINTTNSELSYKKLSIQISLNGLSFCVLDSVENSIIKQEHISFKEEVIPFQLLKNLKETLEKFEITKMSFSNITVIHRNPLFTLVPKALFDPEELPNYLKFNAKILANDQIAYDEIKNYDIVNIYVPFTNVNNYIYELFGEFEYKHSGTILIESLLNNFTAGKEPICYAHITEQQVDITVIANKNLVFYNSFIFETKEDFIYYILFTIEQLKLDTETIKLRLFGSIEEGDELYNLIFTYVRNVDVFIPSSLSQHLNDKDKKTIDFTTLSAF